MSFSTSHVYDKVKHYSALTSEELSYLCSVVKIPSRGPVVVAGSWKGGDVMAMLSYSPIRDYHVVDSFRGLTNPSPEDECGDQMVKGEFDAEGPEDYIQNFKNAGFDAGYLKYVHMHEMFITEESVKEVDIKDIAILWLDLDHYLPTKACLDHFGSSMASDGIILCHDYGFFRRPGIKKACDEFAIGWTPAVGGIFKLLDIPRDAS